jgi:hypothetical protein
MSKLPRKLSWELAQTEWAKQLEPILGNAILKGHSLGSVQLNANQPKDISTGLGRQQQGWIITDLLSNAKVWRTKPFNSTTLTLQADADTTISLWVY